MEDIEKRTMPIFFRPKNFWPQNLDFENIKWMNKKEILVSSNYFDHNIVNKRSRRSKDGSRKQIPFPLAIIQYNKYMRGIDLSVQKLKCYANDRKSKRN